MFAWMDARSPEAGVLAVRFWLLSSVIHLSSSDLETVGTDPSRFSSALYLGDCGLVFKALSEHDWFGLTSNSLQIPFS
jgi:hypothetical protein